MKICIPISENRGIQSAVNAHFGSAPMFMIVETDDESCRVVVNFNAHHDHGQCSPLQAIQGEKIDALIVGGIGMGALGKLMAAGLQVFRAEHPTVKETLEAFRSKTLQPMDPHSACAGHGH